MVQFSHVIHIPIIHIPKLNSFEEFNVLLENIICFNCNCASLDFQLSLVFLELGHKITMFFFKLSIEVNIMTFTISEILCFVLFHAVPVL